MKKAQLIAVMVLVLVAIIVAGQAFAGWGGPRRAGRGPNMEQGSPVYPERFGPMPRGGPWREAPGPDWERGTAGPGWEGGGRGIGRGPETPRPRGGGGRTYEVCPCCGVWLDGGSAARNGFGPWIDRGPGVGRGYGPDQNFQRGQRGSGWRNPRRGDIAVPRRFMRDTRGQGPSREPYRGEQGFRRGDGQRPGWNRMDNWGPPQRRGMGAPGPDGFGPIRPEGGDQTVPPGPPRGRRWVGPQGAQGGQPEQQADPQNDVPAETDGAEPQAGQ